MTTDATPLPATMTHWRQHRYGGPDVVAAESAPVPAPAAGEVLVRVRATGLNSADVRIMRGDPALVRLAFGLRRPRIEVQGRDVAGTVVGVGAGVTSFAVGDEVVGEIAGGGLAPFVAAPAEKFIVRPAGLDPVVVAALPLAGGTAWQALELAGVGARVGVDVARSPDGGAGQGAGAESGAAGAGTVADAGSGATSERRRVLVIGAGGGVGCFAVQLAAGRGHDVTALAGERALPVLAGLGAATVLDRRRIGVEQLAPASFDVVLVIAGAHRLRMLRDLVVPGGAVVLVTGGTNRVTGPLGPMLRAAMMSIGSARPIRSLAAVAKVDVTAELLRLAVSGALTPHIERTWPLAEAGAALEHVDAGHTIGKVVVTA